MSPQGKQYLQIFIVKTELLTDVMGKTMSLHTLNTIEQCRVVIDSIAYFKLNFEKKSVD